MKWIFFNRVTNVTVKKEEDVTRKHQQIFSHVFRRKTLWELVRLSSIMMGIELAYAAETSFVSPILLDIGIAHRYMTMVWSLSACLGVLCSPFIGPLTDRCHLALGRRRPLMIFLAVLLTIGLIVVPHGRRIGQWIDRGSTWAIFFTILGTVMLDFGADNCQTPSRAYLLDMCLPEDHTRALSTFSIMSGVGSFLGYIMGAFDWESLVSGDNIATVFAIAAVTLAICAVCTMTIFREIPLRVLEESSTAFPSEVTQNERKKISFLTYIRSVVKMPSSIKILCLTSLFGWMSDVCYSLYFTDFVGEAVFLGDPTSDSQSSEHALYESGVRFGCLGMAIYAFSCIIFSIVMNLFLKLFRIRTILIGGSSINGLSMLCLATWPTKSNVLLLSIFAGINFAIIFTIPFILIAQYHSTDTFKRNHDDPVAKTELHHRGLGTDIAIVNSSLFLAQIFVSLAIGCLVNLVGSTSAVMYSAGVFSLLAAIVANKVLYLD
ncbi:proton-associated sugar transporter A-like isoform X2 [Phlebotomus argentipes]|uniref:proton-associated sugar transporter A-like isoform X2 n=1 Tax=Phlebotomus argentipes TaxID=94469 RepID=UPI002893010C|nr:proton-associated sugar transporter A-like isoform X2 [Phlebotomus argentipes]